MKFLKILPIRVNAVFIILFLSGFIVSACGSNKGTLNTVFSGEFIPAAPVVPSTFNTIYLESLDPKSNEFLTLDVNAIDINQQVVSINFNIHFSGSVIQFDKIIEGDLFETEFISNPGNIHISISGVDKLGQIGGSKLISIRFRLVGMGSSQLEFTNREFLQPGGENIFFLVSWFGGTVVVQ